jgi:C4-dicarboxylate transporter, DcuC family
VTWEAFAGLGIIALVLVALVRGFEVRLVLLIGAFALAALGRQAEQILIVFFQGLADSSSVVPICSAMGFAYVIQAFGCDRHLVLALSRPLLRVRWLLIPGTILIGFLVNITIISQTSTALAVGTVLVPLLRGFGVKATLIGSALLLGSSIGGELLNPGAPELGAIASKLHLKSTEQLVTKVGSLVFIHLAVATVVFLWWVRADRKASTPPENVQVEEQQIDWFKAIVPVVPLVLLSLTRLPFDFLHWPEHWLVGAEERKALYGPRLIGLSMLAGCLVACLAAPRQAGSVARHFFEGAGYGYIHIISLIVIAKCFSEGIKLSGVTDVIGLLAREMPVLIVPLAGLLPLALAFLSGSGIGATQGLYPPLADIARAQGMDATWIGVVCCIGSAAGRTMSPVAAVAIMCGRLTESTSLELSRRVAVPLLAGMAVVIVLVSMRLFALV